jgi:AraC-like DNA-binding protein
MPIFMDRHDVEDMVTAEQVAQLHQEDLKIQQQFGCRGLTYWFDDKRKTAFCLIEAPDKESLQEMHNCAHGQVPNRIIEVEPSIVESFLGRIGDPEKAKDTELNIINDPAFRILMVIAINRPVPETRETPDFRNSFSQLKKDIGEAISGHEGTKVRTSEDEHLVSFKLVTKAVHAAMAIETLYKKFIKSSAANKHLRLKIALNAGVPVTKNESIFEDTIRMAERMCGITKDVIMVSSEVCQLYRSENTNTFFAGSNICALSAADEKFIIRLMDYTDEVWNDANFKAVDFIRPMGYSKSQLNRKLVALTGKSPNAFIREYRLNKALKLFRKGDHNISEIAFETGFSSPSYFTTCFQKQFGHQPSEYLSLR